MKSLFLFFLIIPNLSFSQKLQQTPEQFVDSLIQSNHFTEANTLYSSFDTNSRAALFAKLFNVETADNLSCQEICNSFRMQKERYDSADVPFPIVAIYQLASSFVDRDQLRQAVKIYYVAFALRYDFIQKEKSRLFFNFERTKTFLASNKQDSLLFYVESYEHENQQSPALRILDDMYHLKQFYSDLRTNIDLKNNLLLYENAHSELYTPTLSCFVEFGGRISAGKKSPSLIVTNYQTGVSTISEPKTLLENQYSASLWSVEAGLSYNFHQNLFLIVNAMVQNFKITDLGKRNEIISDLVFYDSNFLVVYSYQLDILCKYVIRPKIGIRPFAEIGVGFNYNHSEAKELLAVYQYTYYSIEQRNKTFLIPINSGIEFVNSKESIVVYGFKFGVDYYLNNYDLLGKFSTRTSLSVHISIL